MAVNCIKDAVCICITVCAVNARVMFSGPTAEDVGKRKLKNGLTLAADSDPCEAALYVCMILAKFYPNILPSNAKFTSP